MLRTISITIHNKMLMKVMMVIFIGVFNFYEAKAESLKILFIGDSITDGNWGSGGGPSDVRNHSDLNHIYGHGYMYICTAYYMGKYPDKNYIFFNRGISGNTLNDLENRWQKDVLDIKPDILSILIGINDIYSYLNENIIRDFDFKSWEEKYRTLLDRAKNENPNLKIILGTPFVFFTGKMKDYSEFTRCEQMILKLNSIVENIASDYNAVCLTYYHMFENLINKSLSLQDTYWIWDGIHPTAAGHQRMAEMWINAVNKYKLLE